MSGSYSTNGRPVQIAECENGQFHVFKDRLEQVLLPIASMFVVLVSVAGKPRGGNSFLLDFFIRYLEAKGKDGWMGSKSTPLRGFSWRGGSRMNTTGLWLWNKPYERQLPDGRKVAILLMDTQGVFDTESTQQCDTAVFAMSLLLSSVQIYNLKAVMCKDDLDHLKFFVEYGRLAVDTLKEPQNDHIDKMCQRIHFLIRDWPESNEEEYPYGATGGDKLWRSKKDQPDGQNMVGGIETLFEKVDCFLMPHPGLDAEKMAFDGRLSGLTSDFRKHLARLIPLVLATKNLVPKQVFGIPMTAGQLMEFVKLNEVDALQGEFKPETLFTAHAKASHSSAITNAKSMFEEKTEKSVADTAQEANENRVPFVTRLAHTHEVNKQLAVTEFRQTRKIGKTEFSQKYEDDLVKMIGDAYTIILSKWNEIMKQTLQLALNLYKTKMDEVCQMPRKDEAFAAEHRDCMRQAVESFRVQLQGHGIKHTLPVEEQHLEEELHGKYCIYRVEERNRKPVEAKEGKKEKTTADKVVPIVGLVMQTGGNVLAGGAEFVPGVAGKGLKLSGLAAAGLGTLLEKGNKLL